MCQQSEKSSPIPMSTWRQKRYGKITRFMNVISGRGVALRILCLQLMKSSVAMDLNLERKKKMVAMLEMLVIQVGRLRDALVGLIVVDKFADEMDEIAKDRGNKWSNSPESWAIWDRLQRSMKCGCTACSPLTPEECADPVFEIPYLPLAE